LNDEEIRDLSEGDRILISGLRAIVTRVARYTGPLGTSGPLFVDFEFIEGGGGRASGDFLKEIQKLPRSAPSWYDDLMETA
jgi:hypothetical protein